MQDDGPSEKATSQTLHDWLVKRGEQLKTQYAQRDAGNTPMVQVPTGLSKLDAAGLFEPGVLTVAVAHPGDGKTSFALQALEGAARAGFDVQGYFIEDPKKMVADKVIAPIIGESAFQLRRLKVDSPADMMAKRIDAAIGASAWAKRVIVDDEYHETADLLELIEERWTKRTRLIVLDYLQAFDSEDDEKSVERVIARLVWKLNQKAKMHNSAVLALSQPKTREVEDRGRRWFESCRWKARGKDSDGDVQPKLDWVEQFRPTAGDIQWATGATKQRSRSMLSIFRPATWMKLMGVEWKDDTSEVTIIKGNYAPSGMKFVFGWDGPTQRLLERKKAA
jgi:replicative DNA helicase